MPTDAVLELERVSYRYPNASEPVLRELDLRIEAGELVVLAGVSGSGKSTLMRAGCGLVPHFHGGEISGSIRVSGESTAEHGPAELARSVGFVAQEPESQVVSTTVAAELALPLELRGHAPGERARSVEEVALALGIEPLLERTTDSLSGGELQRVAIGAALVSRPPLLLLDEPTSQLDPVAGDELISLLRRLNEEWGVAIVLGEHRLERCLAAADRVVALEAGEVAWDGSAEAFGEAAVDSLPDLAPPSARLFALADRPERPATVKAARRILGVAPRPPSGAESARPDAARRKAPQPSCALGLKRLVVEREGIEAPVIADVDLAITAGERVALMGANGAGKSTLLRCCAGLLQARSGRAEAPAGIALLGQRSDDYFVAERIDDELPGAAGAIALEAVGLAADPGTDPRDLSGGERQRLALAIAMAGRGAGGEPPGAVCLDEPTRGLDPARKRELDRWLRGLAERGAAVIVATHDVEFAAGFAGRVVLLARGAVIADGPAESVLGGGWYFATETARITGGGAITPELGAGLLAASATAAGRPAR